MIVADTSAMLALIDRRDRHHRRLHTLFAADPDEWVLPWVILAEVDYLIASKMSTTVARTFRTDLASGAYHVEWGMDADLGRAAELDRQYADLNFGLVDGVVMAMAERLQASAIATLDRRHFGAVTLRGRPALVPIANTR